MASNFPSDVRAVSNAIVAGAFADLCAVYASDQIGYGDFARLCAARAAELLGVVRWIVSSSTIAVGAWSWHRGRSDAWKPHESFEHWFRDRATYGRID